MRRHRASGQGEREAGVHHQVLSPTWDDHFGRHRGLAPPPPLGPLACEEEGWAYGGLVSSLALPSRPLLVTLQRNHQRVWSIIRLYTG